jgi:hypothetical protein
VRDVVISVLVLLAADDTEGSLVEPLRFQLLGDLGRRLM